MKPRQLAGPRSIPHELAPAARAARKAGWKIYVTGKLHLLWLSPDGHTKIVSGVTMHSGSYSAVLDQLRKAGLNI